jgi:thymidine kinase
MTRWAGTIHSSAVGAIEVICGGMFSGKTEELVRRLRRAEYGKLRVQAFKHAIDQRYSVTEVRSHSAMAYPSTPVSNAVSILRLVESATRVVGIDEAQFFDPDVVQVAEQLAGQGRLVVVAGLDLDFNGAPFGAMPELMAVAESVTKLSAVCVRCGAPASRSQRLVPRDAPGARDTVLVGALDLYEPRCRG